MENRPAPAEEREPDGIITRMIDGKLYTIRVFIGNENAETLQMKYERLPRNRIMTELSKAATCPACIFPDQSLFLWNLQNLTDKEKSMTLLLLIVLLLS